MSESDEGRQETQSGDEVQGDKVEGDKVEGGEGSEGGAESADDGE